MAYDTALAERLRAALAGERGLTEKAMFGGLGFMLDGNMAVAASSSGGLLLRVDPDGVEDLLGEDGAEPFVMRGRAMSGWLRVVPEAVLADDDLRRWVAVGVEAARALPAKAR